MLIGFLILHSVVCLLVAILMLKKRIKVRLSILPAVVFLPVCGLIILIMEMLTVEKQIRGQKDAGMGKATIDDVKYRQIPASEGVNTPEAVPLEEAILVNDAQTKRGLLLEVLQRNPEDYIELLQKARMSDDTELTHYATTTMMEIQSGYELEIHRMESDLEQESTYETWSYYKNQLNRYIQSGLISGSILQIYRLKLSTALKRMMEFEPENRRLMWECIENYIELGERETAEKLLRFSYEKYSDDEKLYRLMVDYCFSTSQGAKIQEVLNLLKKNNVYLSSEGKKWYDFWTKKE